MHSPHMKGMKSTANANQRLSKPEAGAIVVAVLAPLQMGLYGGTAAGSAESTAAAAAPAEATAVVGADAAPEAAASDGASTADRSGSGGARSSSGGSIGSSTAAASSKLSVAASDAAIVALRQAIATGLLLLSAQVRQMVEAFTVSHVLSFTAFFWGGEMQHAPAVSLVFQVCVTTVYPAHIKAG